MPSYRTGILAAAMTAIGYFANPSEADAQWMRAPYSSNRTTQKQDTTQTIKTKYLNLN